MKRILLACFLLGLLVLAGCTGIKNTTLQISGVEEVEAWEQVNLACQATEQCVQSALDAGASMQQAEDMVRCRNEMCEVKIVHTIKAKDPE